MPPTRRPIGDEPRLAPDIQKATAIHGSTIAFWRAAGISAAGLIAALVILFCRRGTKRSEDEVPVLGG